MTKAALVGVVCFLLGAMALSRAADDKACADLPVKYLSCDGDGKDCNLVARFKDMSSCESHNKMSSWYCDTVSKPGKAHCDTTPAPGPKLATGRCVR
jgi:hypothetical protein